MSWHIANVYDVCYVSLTAHVTTIYDAMSAMTTYSTRLRRCSGARAAATQSYICMSRVTNKQVMSRPIPFYDTPTHTTATQMNEACVTYT